MGRDRRGVPATVTSGLAGGGVMRQRAPAVAVAQGGAGARGEKRGHVLAALAERGVAYGIHTAVNRVQPPSADSRINRVPAESQVHQLRS